MLNRRVNFSEGSNVPMSQKLKCIFFFPIAFLVGVIVVALLQLFHVGGAVITSVLGGGLLLAFFFERFVGRAGNFAIMRRMAEYTDNPTETHARISKAEAEEAQPTRLVRVSQIAGFGTGILACFLWSPIQVMDWIGRLPLH